MATKYQCDRCLKYFDTPIERLAIKRVSDLDIIADLCKDCIKMIEDIIKAIK
jgi:hypothetical protein